MRDWFAGKALGGWLASYGEQQEHPAEKMDSDTAPYCEMIARYSYRIADAMIKEGNKP